MDHAELAVYSQQAPATLEGHSAKALVFYGQQQVLEGPDTEGVVILELPSVEAARAWYESPAYQTAREHRFKGANYRVLLVEGIKIYTNIRLLT